MKKILLLFAFIAALGIPVQTFAASSSKNVEEAAKEVSAEPAIGSIQDAMKDFKNLSRKERKEKLKEVKYQLKKFKAEKASGQEPMTNTFLLVIIAILLPPLAVYLHQGEVNNKFWISLVLWLLFYVPGLIYALITILG